MRMKDFSTFFVCLNWPCKASRTGADTNTFTPASCPTQSFLMDKKKQIHLFNSDNTYDQFVVEALLRSVGEKLPFKSTISKHNFGLQNMTEICDNTISRLHIDFAFFVVHANESRLTINENNVDIGYTKVYRALLKATGDKVVVVIGGDSNYKDKTEENQNVLSRWALRKVNLQLKEEYRDGRKSFVFSWDEKHREIHEEALLHFFDPTKIGLKFFPMSQSEMAGKSNVDGASGFAQKTSLAALDLNENPRRQDETRSMAAEKPQRGIADLIIFCSDESTATVVSNMYCLPIMRPPPDVHIGSPSELKSHLAARQVTVCAIIGLLASDLKETALRSNWEKSNYGDLLRTAQRVAEQKVVVIICSDGEKTSQNGEDTITARIKQLLGEKDIILWRKDHEHLLVETKNLKRAFQLNRSKFLPDDGVTKRSTGRKLPLINPVEFTLLLKTRLRRGRISYKEEDVQERLQEWTAPDYIANDLIEKWHSAADAELLIYRERNADNYRVVVNDEKDSQSANKLGDSIIGAVHSFGGYLSSKTESSIGSISDNELGDVLYRTF